MTILLLLNIFFAGFSNMTVTTRIAFAMVRDKGLPYSDWLYKINSETKNPDRILVLVFILDSLLCLMPLISTTAFTAITSITTIGYQLSYAIPIFLRLTTARKRFHLNQNFSLGSFSLVNGCLAFLWLIITSTILFFPL